MNRSLLRIFDEKIYRRYKHKRGFTRLRQLIRMLSVGGEYSSRLNIGDKGAKFFIDSIREERLFSMKNLDGEEEIIRELLESIEDQSIFYDIGAEFGMYSLLAENSAGKVYSFEPDPYNMARLLENKTLNNSDIEVLGFPASDSNSMSRLDVSRENYAPHLSDNSQKGFFTLTKRIDELDIQKPDLVKIDVEGAELKVLKGLSGFLETTEVIFCEIHPENMKSFNDSYEELRGFLEDKGFDVQEIGSRVDQFYIKAT